MDDNVQDTSQSQPEQQQSPENPVQENAQAAGAPAAANVSKEEMNLGLLCHLLGIFTWWLGPLVLWLIKKDESAYINEQGKEALNWQITVAILLAASAMLMFIVIGVIGFFVVPILNLIFCVLGAVAASKGEHFRYPFAIRLLK